MKPSMSGLQGTESWRDSMSQQMSHSMIQVQASKHIYSIVTYEGTALLTPPTLKVG